MLNSIRSDRKFTVEEAMPLDLCLILHAEHGGGNNSTFATRVLTSSGTDTYSAIAAGIGSLKGPRHGGANIKVTQMVRMMQEEVDDGADEDKILDYLTKLLKKQAGDRSGLIYGLGHAVYTLSDPRAEILKKHAAAFAEEQGFADEYRLLENVEKLAPRAYYDVKGEKKPLCSNVDLYSGLVYKMLRIPEDLFTPLFTIARCGLVAHRIEELMTGGRIIRPAYKAFLCLDYVPITERIENGRGEEIYTPTEERII